MYFINCLNGTMGHHKLSTRRQSQTNFVFSGRRKFQLSSGFWNLFDNLPTSRFKRYIVHTLCIAQPIADAINNTHSFERKKENRKRIQHFAPEQKWCHPCLLILILRMQQCLIVRNQMCPVRTLNLLFLAPVFNTSRTDDHVSRKRLHRDILTFTIFLQTKCLRVW